MITIHSTQPIEIAVEPVLGRPEFQTLKEFVDLEVIRQHGQIVDSVPETYELYCMKHS